MAYVPEEAVWKEGVYQLEEEDPVLGGVDGVSNYPSIDLACRTLFLKDRIEQFTLSADVLSSPADTRADVIEAGVPYTVPEYTVGANQLTLTLDGVCCEGDGYTYSEIGEDGEKSTTIAFMVDIPVNFDIFVRRQ